MQVNENGLISLATEEMVSYNPRQFPTYNTLIAPFWADVDTRSDFVGRVEYWTATDNNILTDIAATIRLHFLDFTSFSPTYAFIVTWDEVGRFLRNTTLVRYYQQHAYMQCSELN